MSQSSKDKRSLQSSTSSSTEKTVTVPSVSLAYTPRIAGPELYVYTLKLLLLEYTNEPRFRKFQAAAGSPQPTAVQQQPPLVRRTPRRNFSGEDETSRIFQISNGFKNTPNKVIKESDCLQDALPRLENQLSKIAIKEVKISNENLRRSLLKFYNDVFLNPSMRSTLDYMERFEELVVHFTKAANGELNKLVIGNVQKELHAQVSFFIDLVINISKNLPTELVIKLQRYKESSTPQRHRFREVRTPSNDTSTSTASSSSSASSSASSLASSRATPRIPSIEKPTPPKPTFRLEEITHSGFFKELFGVDDIKLQQDVVKVIKEPLADIYCKELSAIGDSIRKGTGALQMKDFPSEKDYNLWANIELSEIGYLKDKFNPEGKPSNPTSMPHSMVPENPRDAFVALSCRIFKHENSVSMNALNLSKSALFFLQRASKCWRVEFFSTLSCLVYTAANLSILQDSELNEKLTENVFNFMQSKILRSEIHMDTSMWNDVDQQQWIVNLYHTSNQCVMSLDNLLSALYSFTKPKFSPILSFYYTYIEADPAMILFKELTGGLDFDVKIKKRLRKTIFKASEDYYLSLLDKVPKDKSIEIQHVQNVGELIIKEIQSLQKRYNKPLLDIINIPFESASVLIQAFASDAPVMIRRVEKYTSVGPTDALEMYDVFKELRNIYSQVQTKKAFPINVEKLFTKYLSQLCDEASAKVLGVIKESIKNENWEPVNPEVHYSASVVDIFRMINASIGLFKRLEWQNNYQIAKIITFLLKSFSDGLHYYAGVILKMIEEDLSDDTSEFIISEDDNKENNLGSEKSKTSWMDGMKSALRNSQPIELPKPYQFKPQTCVLLNNLNSVIEKLNDLDAQLNLEELSDTIKIFESKHQKTKSIANNIEQQLHQLYTIRVIGAENIRGFSSIDGLSNPTLSLVDTSQQREIAKTKIIRKSINPVWDEEFEMEIPVGNTRTIALTIWHRPSGKLRRSSHEVCGKCSFLLDSKRYTDDGFPNAVTLDLDTQGKVFLEISLESEKLDAVFCIGRAYRTVSRALDRAIELITHKFSAFVNFAFSRSTLKAVCGTHGTTQSPKGVIYDAIVPLFDYLNANLNILASKLTQQLLFRIMLRAWSSILAAADGLLLPSLSMAKIKKLQSTKSLWGNAMHALGNSSVVGYGRPLTQREIEVIFIWLNALCIDFFHNGGEGPPLGDLKNKYYQTILLIPVYYDESISALKKEAERLAPEYTKYLQQKTLETNSPRATSTRSKTIARKKTIMANATRKNRKKAEMDVQNDESDPLERSAETLDIVLRTLMAKDEVEYVQKQLHNRKKIRKSLTTERRVQAAIRGQKIK
ncbi:ZYRO0G15554p [Zygosaccharomyces rouxii]|uniref:ZYRO0G15554p n=1 Tax=Zygosaccharomyces rouxii (strain ATCC 2623 / CBS 732 / NBRC 1130 / NCYC 568 / NRRL Y-229) TaxID=559307 RepID=C5E0T9_ZYGRC|nr:uncharacterized protein ZYRO0G15554g [Zygosaccharomyces rouxii]CAR29723.1 ZYRO0G15554p [Zygosaccharomyces rouxii]